MCAPLFDHLPFLCIMHTAEHIHDRNPAQYILTLEQMIENEYPIPSYMADIFEKPVGWLETPEQAKEGLLDVSSASKKQKIYAIDCEMVPILYHPNRNLN